MIHDSGLTEEDVLLKRVLLSACMSSEERLSKKYLCGYEACQSRECFDTWKHVQQHYKNYHKVTVKKKDAWDESIPKIREIEANEVEDDGEISPPNKRKRSAKTDPAVKAGNESPVATTVEPLESESTKFIMLLSNATLLAKVTSDFSLLQDQIKNVVLNGMTTEEQNKDPSISSSVVGKLKEFNDKKSSLVRSIEIGKVNCQVMSQVQKKLLDQVSEMNGKELINTLEFANYYLSCLQLRVLEKNPEYIALLALHELLKDDVN